MGEHRRWKSGLIVGIIFGGLIWKGLSLVSRNWQATRPQGTFGGFSKRTYHSWREGLAEIRYLVTRRAFIHRAMKLVSPAFQHRLMLAVTHVNGCRYCARYHAQLALRDGLTVDEVQELLGGAMDSCPLEEVPALRYAQHFAESNKHPDPEMFRQLVDTYGLEKAQAIELVIRMISLGNYFGNTLDYFLYRISGGKWGNRRISNQ